MTLIRQQKQQNEENASQNAKQQQNQQIGPRPTLFNYYNNNNAGIGTRNRIVRIFQFCSHFHFIILGHFLNFFLGWRRRHFFIQ